MKAKARIIFDRRHVATATHPAPITIEVSHNGTRKWLPTGIAVTLRQWNAKRQEVINRHDSDILNADLRSQFDRILTIIAKHGDNFSFAHLDEKPNQTFLEWMESYYNSRTDIKPSTRPRHRYVIEDLKAYGGIVDFSDITLQNILAYQNHLHEKGISQVSVYNYEKTLRSYIKIAQQLSLISMDGNPYDKIHVNKGKSSKRKYLEYEDLQKIINLQLEPGVLDRVRDLFLFQAFTGLSYSDMASLTPNRYVQRNGDYYIIDTRIKTDEDFYIKLITPAVDILRKYDFQLPIINNSDYNHELKTLAALAGIAQTLTTHMARHTFAVFALNNGIDMATLSKMLGHSDIRTTQIYAKIIQKTTDTAFDHLDQILTTT